MRTRDILRRGRTWLRRAAADTRGQSLVEFAFVVPMLVVMLIGMVDFARLWMQYQIITDAAREAARQAVIANELDLDARRSQVIAGVTSAMTAAGVEGTVAPLWGCQAPGTGSTVDIEVYECGWGGERGDPASVTIRAPYRLAFLGPFIGWMNAGDQTLVLTTSITMRNE
jgi:hypothetical protein